LNGISPYWKILLENREFHYWAKLSKTPKPKISYLAIAKEIDTIQAIKIKNDLYNDNFKKLIEQVNIFSILRFPNPQNLISLAIL
jgi:hypothetical protein